MASGSESIRSGEDSSSDPINSLAIVARFLYSELDAKLNHFLGIRSDVLGQLAVVSFEIVE